MRSTLLLLTVGVLASCTPEGGGSMAPIGEGLRFLGIALVVAVLVAVLGLSRNGGGRHG